MGRPRTVKVEGGEITFSNFPPERADELEQMLSGVSSLARGVVPSGPMDGVAIGLTYNKTKKMFEVAVIAYNPETKEAVVKELKTGGEYRSFAINAFKIECVEKGLI